MTIPYADLVEWAIADARTTFEEEQLEYWYCNVVATNPPAAKDAWLRSRMEDESPTDRDFEDYHHLYNAALVRAIRKLNKEWPRVEAAIADNVDADDVVGDVEHECVQAMEKVRR